MNPPQLHVIVDVSFAQGRLLPEVVAAVLAGGADVVQLRDKMASSDGMEKAARSVQAAVRSAGARLVINDHWEVARDVGADGVHVGADDTPVDVVRRACPRPFLVGASARTAEAAGLAAEQGADYLGVGPVFGTRSKPDAPEAIGLERIMELATSTRLPIIGIGGVSVGNALDVIQAGASGVAVLSGIVAAQDPEAATRRIRRRLDLAR